MRSNLRNREKRPLTVEQRDRLERRRMYQDQLVDDREKIRHDRIHLEREKYYNEDHAYNFVKRMRNLEDRKGKHWVETKTESHDIDGRPMAALSSLSEESDFVQNLYNSKGCTEDEKDLELVRLRSIYEATVKEHQEGLWWTWFAFRHAQRTGVYDDEQKLYAAMLHKLEEEDKREEAYGLMFFNTDLKRMAEIEAERERYMREEYAVNLADPANETWNNRWPKNY